MADNVGRLDLVLLLAKVLALTMRRKMPCSLL
jgi:hypothetical protein